LTDDLNPTVTLAERAQSLLGCISAAGLILLIGLGLLKVIGKSSITRRRHGKFVLSWVIAGWLLGGMIGVSIADNAGYCLGEVDVGMAGFGLLIGWAVGMVHGAIVIASRP
jgi:hypothetical protein